MQAINSGKTSDHIRRAFFCFYTQQHGCLFPSSLCSSLCSSRPTVLAYSYMALFLYIHKKHMIKMSIDCVVSCLLDERYRLSLDYLKSSKCVCVCVVTDERGYLWHWIADQKESRALADQTAVEAEWGGRWKQTPPPPQPRCRNQSLISRPDALPLLAFPN